MNGLIGITVSVNFSDYLERILSHNQQFFEKWFIVTEETDRKTIDLVAQSGYSNIELLFYDFKTSGATFNKGGGQRCAQKIVHAQYPGHPVLMLDSDILLPYNFADIMNGVQLEPDTLYAPENRKIYNTLENFEQDKVDRLGPAPFIGFFQLYLADNKYFYRQSMNCYVCDDDVRDRFMNKVRINGLVVKHLGPISTYGNGRESLA
jgi:hypothetical protein